ncbi:MAG: CBS domain-containing protein [Acidobacteria bacterium]|nr:CBS domain-containing protein [Acidobacteriota bacterium]
MVLLTELLRCEVADERGRKAKLSDVSVALLEDDYPPVTHLLVLENGESWSVEWVEVVSFDRKARTINVRDLKSAKKKTDDKNVRLKRDVLDALVIDLSGRRTARVTDLLLREEDDALRVKGVDAGLAAMLRRVTGGRLGRLRGEALFDWKYVEFLRGDPSAVAGGAGYRMRISRLPAGQIAKLTDYIPYLHAAELLKLLPDDKGSDVLQAMSVKRQVQVIGELDEDEALGLIQRMPPDLAADLIGCLEPPLMKRYLNLLPERLQKLVVELLRYPENTVGGVMTNDVICLAADSTVEDALKRIEEFLERMDFISLVFLVDDTESKNLRGSITLRHLLIADAEKRLKDVMTPYLETLDPYDSANSASYQLVTNGVAAMPVVDKEGKLLGAVTADAAISQLVPNTSDLQALRLY